MKDSYIVKISEIKSLNHNVKRFRVEKPLDYIFDPGQATEIAVNESEYEDKFRPFTFTSLNSDPFLEFIIKIYNQEDFPNHSGVTEKIGTLERGKEFVIKKPFGSIKYKGEGLFLAGGTGVTPFYPIFKDLSSRNDMDGNKLFFSNKFKKDIFLEDELRGMLGDDNVFLTLTQEEERGYKHGRIDKDMIKEINANKATKYYVCGPISFQKSIMDELGHLGVLQENIVVEGW